MRILAKQMSAFSLSILILAGLASAQKVQTKTMTFDADATVFINEIAGIVQLENDTLVLTMVAPPDHRADDYKEVDLKKGDRLLMCNGKRLKDIATLRQIIEEAEPGDKIKFGIVRDGHMALTSFPKGDPESMGGQMVMMTTEIDDGGAGMEKTISIGGGGGIDGTVIVLDGGIIVSSGQDGPIVLALMPDASEHLKGTMPKEGDRILSINGEIDSNMQALQALYDKIPEGEEITVKFERDGEKHSTTYVKTALTGGGQMIIEK